MTLSILCGESSPESVQSIVLKIFFSSIIRFSIELYVTIRILDFSCGRNKYFTQENLLN